MIARLRAGLDRRRDGGGCMGTVEIRDPRWRLVQRYTVAEIALDHDLTDAQLMEEAFGRAVEDGAAALHLRAHFTVHLVR